MSLESELKELSSIVSLFESEANAIIQDITISMSDEGANASGKTVRSLENKNRSGNYQYILEVQGDKAFDFVEVGRGKTKSTSGRGVLRGIIRQWIDDKGVFGSLSDTEKESLSFAITKSIHARGTLLNFLKVKRKIYTHHISDARIARLIKNVEKESIKQLEQIAINSFG